MHKAKGHFNKYLLGAYYVSDTVAYAQVLSVNKKVLAFMELRI